jgi:hypothetical protein
MTANKIDHCIRESSKNVVTLENKAKPYLVRPPRDGNVQSVVAANFAISPLPPLLVGLEETLALLRDHEVD